MIKAGIVDPIEDVRTALQNASSVAGLMLTTEAAVVEKSKEDKGGGGHPGGGMGGMEGMMESRPLPVPDQRRTYP